MAKIKTAMPQLDLRDGSVITVDVGSAGAVLTSVVIHGFQTIDGGNPPPAEPLWLPIPSGVGGDA